MKVEILLLLIGGCIRIFNLSSDIWYLVKITYKSTFVKYLSISSLVAPTLILLTFFFLFNIKSVCNKRAPVSRLTIAFLLIIGDSFGLNYFIFSVILCKSSVYSGDFFIIDSLFRITTILNTLIQSMPQLIFQIYNNQITLNWSLFTILSLFFSILPLLYNFFKLLYAVDKIKIFEEALKFSQTTASSRVSSTSNINHKDLTPPVPLSFPHPTYQSSHLPTEI